MKRPLVPSFAWLVCLLAGCTGSGAASADSSTDATLTESVPVRCEPGRTQPCLCGPGRAGVQTCGAGGAFEACVCAVDAGSRRELVEPDAGPADDFVDVPDVAMDRPTDAVPSDLGRDGAAEASTDVPRASYARLLRPLSGMRVTTQRPTLRWRLPMGVRRARLEICRDRPCTRAVVAVEVEGNEYRPPERLQPGATFWRVTALGEGDAGAGEGWRSPTWQFWVERYDTPVDDYGGQFRDVTGDGVDDFVATDPRAGDGRYDGRVYIYRGGTVPSGAPFSTLSPRDGFPRQFSMWTRIADFNGDGVADIACTSAPDVSMIAGLVQTLGPVPVGDVIANTRAPLRYAEGILPTALDLNGDGYVDLFYMEESSRLINARLGGEGGISTQSRVVVSNVPVDATAIGRSFAGDLNEDGLPDFVDGRICTRNPCYGNLYLSGDDLAYRRVEFNVQTAVPNSYYGESCDLGQHGDERWVALGGHRAVEILKFRGGALASSQVIAEPEASGGTVGTSFGGEILCADFNADGWVDLLVGAGSSSVPSHQAYLYRAGLEGIPAVPTLAWYRPEGGVLFGEVLGVSGEVDTNGKILAASIAFGVSNCHALLWDPGGILPPVCPGLNLRRLPNFGGIEFPR